VRHPLALLTVLALIAIGAAAAHEWPAATRAEKPRLAGIELRMEQERAPARSVRATAKGPRAGRVRRKKLRRVRAPLRRRAATPAGRGVSPNPALAAPRSKDDDGGARPARVPASAPAGANNGEGDDEGGIVGGVEGDGDGGDGSGDD